MPTLGELKARVLDEVGDGASVRLIGQHIARAIEQLAGERFWFNQATEEVATTPGSSVAAAPPGLRREDQVLCEAGGGGAYRLERRSIEEIEEARRMSPLSSGLPQAYAFQGAVLKLHPAPGGIFTLHISGVYDLPALSDDGASNGWTEAAADLVVCRAKASLYRDILGDIAKSQIAASQEEEALRRLRAETVARLGLGRLRAA